MNSRTQNNLKKGKRIFEYKEHAIESLETCDGCGACEDVCPPKANSISMKTDIEGFWYPEIDHSTCTNCGLCDWVCPELHHEELKTNDLDEPVCYAAHDKNIATRFDSTSGGIFSVLANQTYQDGGYVSGAIYNEDFSVSHLISNKKADLPKLRSSKYLQSNMAGIFKKTKKLVRDGEKVLVVGCPCQMAAMKRFVRRDYDNLILVDFVCLGINSPKVWRKYLDYLESKYQSAIKYIKAKNKELGWRKLTTKITFENGNSHYDTRDTSLYTQGYIGTRAFCRPVCHTCEYKGFPRVADITLADFWGIENVDKSLDNDLGTSGILINSKKGEKFFEGIKGKIKSREVSINSILPRNPALVSSLKPSLIDRDQFFKDLDLMPFDDVAQKHYPIQKPSFKHQIKIKLLLLYSIALTTSCRPLALLQMLKINFFKRAVSSNIWNGNIFIPASNSVINIHKSAFIKISGIFQFGKKKFNKSKLESRILVDKNAKFNINGNVTLMYGCDIEVFEGATLTINDGTSSNINTTIICGNKIVIGENTKIGRDVTIRDTNGGHYVSLQGYKNSSPVFIGKHVWLGSGCTIMPGVKIGDGAIVSANALVNTDVPPNSLVFGVPAKVINNNISWR